jgi:hypothetical protein
VRFSARSAGPPSGATIAGPGASATAGAGSIIRVRSVLSGRVCFFRKPIPVAVGQRRDGLGIRAVLAQFGADQHDKTGPDDDRNADRGTEHHGIAARYLRKPVAADPLSRAATGAEQRSAAQCHPASRERRSSRHHRQKRQIRGARPTGNNPARDVQPAGGNLVRSAEGNRFYDTERTTA